MPINNHIKSLDGVRGLAILMVMFYHMVVVEGVSPFDNFILQSLQIGWCGVDLFFVLSGFLITGILIDTRKDNGFYKKFYARRFIRIMPLYYALLIFSLIFIPLVDHPKAESFDRISGDEIYYVLFIQNFSIAAANTFRHGILDVTWSLAIEEQFYLFCPFLVAAFSKKNLCKILIAFFLASTLLRSGYLFSGGGSLGAYVLTPMRLEGLTSGGLLAVVMRMPELRAQISKWVKPTFTATASILLVLWIASKGEWNSLLIQTIGYPIIAAFFTLFIYMALHGNKNKQFQVVLESKFLGLMGKYSYAMYLTHLPIRAVFRDTIFKPEDFFIVAGSVLPAQFLFIFCASATTLLVSYLSWHLLEKHFLRLKKFFNY